MHDVACDQFVIAGQAWRDSQAGKVDPQFFACGPYWRGYSIIGFNLAKDLALLNKREELSLGSWGLMRGMEGQWSADECALLDEAVKHTLADNNGFDAMRAFYDAQDRLRVPEKVLVCDYVPDTFSERESI